MTVSAVAGVDAAPQASPECARTPRHEPRIAQAQHGRERCTRRQPCDPHAFAARTIVTAHGDDLGGDNAAASPAPRDVFDSNQFQQRNAFACVGLSRQQHEPAFAIGALGHARQAPRHPPAFRGSHGKHDERCTRRSRPRGT